MIIGCILLLSLNEAIELENAQFSVIRFDDFSIPTFFHSIEQHARRRRRRSESWNCIVSEVYTDLMTT